MLGAARGVMMRQRAAAGPLFEEQWTGTNGDAWNATRWPTTVAGANTIADIQSNEGRTHITSGTYNYIHKLTSLSIADFDLRLIFRFGHATAEQYPLVHFRVGGTWTNTVIAPQGYIVDPWILGATNRLYVGRCTGGGAHAIIQEITKSGGWGTSNWNMRVQAIGSALKVKTWQGAEPGTWEIEATNSAWSAAGPIALGTNPQTTGSTFWDAMTVNSV